MSEIASAFVTLLPSAKNFGRSTEKQIGPQLSGVAKSTGSKFGTVFARSSIGPLKALGVAAVGLFAVDKIKDFFGTAISEARESQKVGAITANVIRSTGQAANISAVQVGNLSTAISNKTGIDDEAIQSGANLLLTFTNIRNEVGKGNDIFNQATQSITDLGAAMGTDPKAAAIQLGKALNDPIKGITALTRVGVSFTDQQKTQIAAMVKSGNTLGAQKIILGELNKEFGGTAAAAGTAGEKLKTNFLNFAEAIGTSLLPYLDKAEGALGRLVVKMTANINPAFASFKQKIVPIADALIAVGAAVDSFIQNHLKPAQTFLSGIGGATFASFAILIGSTVVEAVGLLVSALASPVAIIGFLAGAALYAYNNFAGFHNEVDSLAQSFMTKVVPALQQFGQYLLTVVVPNVVSFAQTFAANVIPALLSFATFMQTKVIPIVVSFAQFFATQIAPVIGQVASKLATDLVPSFKQLWSTLKTQVFPAVSQLLTKFHEYQPEFQAVIAVVAKAYAKFLEMEGGILGKVLPVVIKFAGILITALVHNLTLTVTAIGTVIRVLGAIGGAIGAAIGAFTKFAAAVKSKVGEALSYIKAIPGKVKSALGNVGTLLFSAGQQLIEGFVNGVKSKAADLANAAKDAASNAVSGVKGLLGIHSPSRVFADIGKNTMDGFAKGVTDNSDSPAKAIAAAAKKAHDALMAAMTKTRDDLQTKLDGIKSDFSSLADSVSTAFTGDMFSATTGQGLAVALSTNGSLLDKLLKAFRKLKKEGLSPAFLSALYQSGNAPLILSLAQGPAATALAASSEFNTDNTLSSQLGQNVAKNQYGKQLDKIGDKLDRIEAAINRLGHKVGHEINGAASKARTRAAA